VLVHRAIPTLTALNLLTSGATSWVSMQPAGVGSLQSAKTADHQHLRGNSLSGGGMDPWKT
jgi:hypothetical protein